LEEQVEEVEVHEVEVEVPRLQGQEEREDGFRHLGHKLLQGVGVLIPEFIPISHTHRLGEISTKRGKKPILVLNLATKKCQPPRKCLDWV